MRLNLQEGPAAGASHVRHTDAVTAVAWSSAGELFSCSDDHTLLKWNPGSSDVTSVADLGAEWHPLKMEWCPSPGGKRASEVLAVSSDDGKFRLINKSGRVDKVVEAHNGAVIDLRWSADGATLVTAGEDGKVKIWSKSGMLRSVLVQAGTPVYAVAWSTDSTHVLYASATDLVIKPLQPSAKTEQWKAHDGVILGVDWSRANNLIASVSEDRKYKVWDAFGRPVYSSGLHDHPLSSVSWAPDGTVFAVGGYNTLRLCDRAGWSHSLEKPTSGSIYSIGWTDDSTRLAGAGANGSTVLADVVEQRSETIKHVVTLTAPNAVLVQDVIKGTTEHLDFRDRVVKLSMAFEHLVVATTTQCMVYSTANWNTPSIFDLKAGSTVTHMCLSPKHFATVDAVSGVQVYTYDGRNCCNPKFNNMHADQCNELSMSLSDDTVAIVDHRDRKAVHLFDLESGKELGKPIVHQIEILEVALEQSGSSLTRHLAVIDKNRDLYLTPVRATKAHWEKLAAMVQSMAWHDATGMLAGLLDGKFSVWYCPRAVYVDKDILPLTRCDKDVSGFGNSPRIMRFEGQQCTVRRADGSVLVESVSAYPTVLHRQVSARKWDDAIRLCRFMKDKAMWACLAALAASAHELNSSEIAYAAIDEVDKVEYIQHIKEIPTAEGRHAAMALFCRQTAEAESILLRAALHYRAIAMNCDVFKWERALELAVKHKTHVDTVLARRQSYLESFGRQETSDAFLEYSGVEIDWDAIQAKIAAEEESERSRPGAKPYS